MPRYNDVTLKKANCNGIIIILEKHWARGEPEADAFFTIAIGDQYDDHDFEDIHEYDLESDARKAFEGFVEEYKNKPNWNAQAAYDEEHGTINGEDPGIAEMRELWGC